MAVCLIGLHTPKGRAYGATYDTASPFRPDDLDPKNHLIYLFG